MEGPPCLGGRVVLTWTLLSSTLRLVHVAQCQSEQTQGYYLGQLTVTASDLGPLLPVLANQGPLQSEAVAGTTDHCPADK
jgi:hypothetical protein